jgi:molybdate transport system permease protein
LTHWLAPPHPEEWEVLLTTLKVAGVAVAGGMPVAFLSAWALARWRFPGRAAFDTLLHLPLVLPPVVTGYLLLLALGPGGAVGAWLEETLGWRIAFHWSGAALAAGVMSLPLMVRPLVVALGQIDPRLEQAAATLGAGWWARLFTVVLPLARPGIIAALILGFARSLGEFGATITLAANIPGETRTLASATWGYLQHPDGEAPALRLALMSVAIAVAALVAAGVWERRLARGPRPGADGAVG